MARSFLVRALGSYLNAHKSVKFQYECLEHAFLGYKRTRIADAKPGGVIKVVGRLRAGHATRISPLTGGSAVWYRTVVQPWEGEFNRLSEIREERSVSMFVDDESGSARLDMTRARLSLEEMRQEWSYVPPLSPDSPGPATAETLRKFMAQYGAKLRYRRRGILERLLSHADWPQSCAARYREFVLRDRDRIAVLGEVTQEPDPTAHADGGRQTPLRLVFGESSRVIVSNEPGACA